VRGSLHDGAREVSGSGRAHGRVRATHRKSLEFVRERDIGDGATCVVAVDVSFDEASAESLSGWVELRIEAGDACDTVRARINPAFTRGDPLIVRRGGNVTRDALLIDADKAASDLDRELVRALSRDGAAVAITLREVDDKAPGTLVVRPGEPWAAPGTGGRAGPDALATLAAGGRVELDADLAGDPGAAELVAAAADAGHVVLPARGLAPVAAAVAVAGVPAVRTIVLPLGAPASGTVALTAGTCVVVRASAGAIARWLGSFDDVPGARGAVGLDVGSQREQWLRWRPGLALAAPGGPGRAAIAAVGVAAGEQDPEVELPPAVTALARELLERGASTRDVAALLERHTDLGRNEAYGAALALTPRA
jgi:hypothetical protein